MGFARPLGTDFTFLLPGWMHLPTYLGGPPAGHLTPRTGGQEEVSLQESRDLPWIPGTRSRTFETWRQTYTHRPPPAAWRDIPSPLHFAQIISTTHIPCLHTGTGLRPRTCCFCGHLPAQERDWVPILLLHLRRTGQWTLLILLQHRDASCTHHTCICPPAYLHRFAFLEEEEDCPWDPPGLILHSCISGRIPAPCIPAFLQAHLSCVHAHTHTCRHKSLGIWKISASHCNTSLGGGSVFIEILHTRPLHAHRQAALLQASAWRETHHTLHTFCLPLHTHCMDSEIALPPPSTSAHLLICLHTCTCHCHHQAATTTAHTHLLWTALFGGRIFAPACGSPHLTACLHLGGCLHTSDPHLTAHRLPALQWLGAHTSPLFPAHTPCLPPATSLCLSHLSFAAPACTCTAPAQGGLHLIFLQTRHHTCTTTLTCTPTYLHCTPPLPLHAHLHTHTTTTTPCYLHTLHCLCLGQDLLPHHLHCHHLPPSACTAHHHHRNRFPGRTGTPPPALHLHCTPAHCLHLFLCRQDHHHPFCTADTTHGSETWTGDSPCWSLGLLFFYHLDDTLDFATTYYTLRSIFRFLLPSGPSGDGSGTGLPTSQHLRHIPPPPEAGSDFEIHGWPHTPAHLHLPSTGPSLTFRNILQRLAPCTKCTQTMPPPTSLQATP